ncbi:MAG TPA: universal stress protein [Spirochaetales bacterium]|nr:universal stress protein [Spirochaetales bacterium]HRY54752.1 universal stress protein [Spirochaetia bacterium]HRZ66371.1 universal stress protein [Spirochaetia bacterium]
MKGLLSNLLVVVNGTDSSISAAKYALALAKALGSAVTAAYVVDTATIRQLAMSRIFIAEEGEEYERSLEDTGRRYLSYVEELAVSKRIKLETRLLKGSIAGEIAKLAEDIAADCVLLGGWERESSFRDVIRDAHRELLGLAPCSVLVVNALSAESLFKSL